MLLRTTRGDPARVLSNSLQTQGIEVPPRGGGRGNNAGALVAGKPARVMLLTGLLWPNGMGTRLRKERAFLRVPCGAAFPAALYPAAPLEAHLGETPPSEREAP